MGILWEDRGWDDYIYWQSQDKKTLKRINNLIKDAQRNPFDGIGKPEALKDDLQGFWSRRINEVDRLIYEYIDGNLRIIACKGHYE
jgi:toxin YoeB